MSIRLECHTVENTNFSQLEAEFSKIFSAKHAEEEAIMDNLKQDNLFEIEFDDVEESFNNNIKNQSDQSRNIISMINRFFRDKQRKLDRKMRPYKIGKKQRFDVFCFKKFIETLNELSYLCTHLEIFKKYNMNGCGISKKTTIVTPARI